MIGQGNGAKASTSKGFALTVVSTSRGEVRKDSQGRDYGYARMRYLGGGAGPEGAEVTVMARGKALDACRGLFGPESYAGPVYGVFVTGELGRKFSGINTSPPPGRRAA